LEKLDEYKQEALEITGQWQWNHVLWAQQHYKKSPPWGIMSCGFQRLGKPT